MPGNEKNIPKKVDDVDSDDDCMYTLPLSDDSEFGSPNSDNEENEFNNEEIFFPGLVLKDEYILLKKIGFGNNANVWMVYEISAKRFLAMKIQDDKCYLDGRREVAIILKINEYVKKNKNKNMYCVTMLDFFVYEQSTEMKFVCTLYDLYAGSIHMVLRNGKHKYGLPISVVKDITKQLLKALEMLHNDLRIIHTDVKPENILFKGIPEYHQKIMDLFIKSDFQKKYDKLVTKYDKSQQKFFIDELAGLAFECVKNICLLDSKVSGNEELIPDEENEDDDEFIEGEDDESDGGSSNDSDFDNTAFNKRCQSVNDLIEHIDYHNTHDIEVDGNYDFASVLNNRANGTTRDTKTVIDDKYILNCQTALTDFGNSYFFEKRTRNEIQDRRYRAPEVVLDLNYGYACDIWSVGCVVFELITGFALFVPEVEPLTKDIHHLFLMEKMLGPIPQRMKEKSRRRRFLFDKKRNYHIKNIKEFSQCSLKERLVKQFLFSEEDAEAIVDFLKNAFEYSPEKRATASDLLKHKWLN